MKIHIRKETVDPAPVGKCNDIALVSDLDGDGRPDIVMGGKLWPHATELDPATYPNLSWYRFPGWERLPIGTGDLEAGGTTLDITGNGLPDIVAGEQGKGHRLFWWENPGAFDTPTPWRRRVLTDRFERYHDQFATDIDGDGRQELLALSQNAGVFFYFDIPENPRIEPWPEGSLQIIAENFVAEGIQAADIDGDGEAEIFVGHHLFKRDPARPRGPWQHRTLLPDLKWSRCCLADLRGSGHVDLVLSEAEQPDSRLLWLEGPDYQRVHELGTDFCALHTLGCADFSGNGLPDILAAEMALVEGRMPRVLLFLNGGEGRFTRHAFENPLGCHEGKLFPYPGERAPRLLIKPYAPANFLELWSFVFPG